MNDFDKGWLVAMLEADAGIYSEANRHGKRRTVIDLEASNLDAVQRMAKLIGSKPPRLRGKRVVQACNWQKDVYRVRIRGEAAAGVLLSLFDLFTPDTQRRAAEAMAK